jgi:hypothetical protein
MKTTETIPKATDRPPVWPDVYAVKRGDKVEVCDAAGDWHQVTASRDGVDKGHRFPVLWVKGTGRNNRPYELPWPIESVRGREQ